MESLSNWARFGLRVEASLPFLIFFGLFANSRAALWLKVRLLFREGTVVTSVPSHVLDEGKVRSPIPPTTAAGRPAARSPS